MRRRILMIGGGLVFVGLGGLALLGPCWSSYLTQGLSLDSCPVGEPQLSARMTLTEGEQNPRLSFQVWGAALSSSGLEMTSEADRWDLDLSLQREGSEEAEVLACGDEVSQAGWLSCQPSWEALPDGEHLLRAIITAPFDEPMVLELPLVTAQPARFHLMSDRGRYAPGDQLLARVLVVGRDSLKPLPQRAGLWELIDPSGVTVMEERGRTSDWGVASFSSYLSPAATQGEWSLRWSSGEDQISLPLDLRPFTLPELSMELSSSQSWYRPGETVSLSGRVTSPSGEPIRGARVRLSWTAESGWPLPPGWDDVELKTDRRGRFEHRLSPVPEDLAQQVDLTARVSVLAEGDRSAEQTLTLPLSHTGLTVDAVTELGEGLVSGYSNRVYLRLRSPDGAPLADREAEIRAEHDPETVLASGKTDAMGVISLQLDPGEPVSWVEEPPAPRESRSAVTDSFRQPGLQQLLQLPQPGSAAVMLLQEYASSLSESCRWQIGEQRILEQVLEIRDRIQRVAPRDSPLEDCVARHLMEEQPDLPAGVLKLSWVLSPPPGPRLTLHHTVQPNAELHGLLARASQEASACLTPELQESLAPWDDPGSALPWSLIWSLEADSAQVRTRIHQGEGPKRGLACVKEAFSELRLEQPARSAALGASQLRLERASAVAVSEAQPTTRSGYAFLVRSEGEEASWRTEPGFIPPLRLRPNKVIVQPGDRLTVELLRGPNFVGRLPRLLELRQGSTVIAEAEVNTERRVVSWEIPEGAQGMLHASYQDASASVYVPPAQDLSLKMSSSKESYRPGEELALQLETSSPAVISLVGSDRRLEQVGRVPRQHDLQSALQPKVESTLTGLELAALSQLPQAESALQALILGARPPEQSDLRVTEATEVEQVFSLEGAWEEAFRRAFPLLLAELGRWEAEAEPEETLRHETLEQLWKTAVVERDDPPLTPWELPMHLRDIPPELLVYLDPRELVEDGTRLPEDFVDWVSWARGRKP